MFKKDLLYLTLLPFIAMVLMIPFMSNTDIPLNDDFFNHLIAIGQAKIALMQGQFPLRTFSSFPPDAWLYPYFQFYSPTTYTLAGFIHIFIGPDNPIIAFKITLTLAMIFGGIYMYRLAKWFFESESVSILVSASYIASPYLLMTIHHMGAFNEAIALFVLPAVLFYTLKRYYHSDQLLTLLQCSFFWYLLATIHLISFVVSSFFIAVILIWITLKKMNRTSCINLIDTCIAYFFGCLLAAWQLLPIVLFARHLNIHTTFNNSDFFYLASPTLAQLLSPIGNISEDLLTNKNEVFLNTIENIHPNLGIFLLFAIGLSVYAFFRKNTSLQKPFDTFFLPFLFLCIFAFLITWTPFNFWEKVPSSLRFIQYGYRLLGQLTWLAALLFGWLLYGLFQNTLSFRYVCLMIILLLFSSSYWVIQHQKKGSYFENLKIIKHFNHDYLINSTTSNFLIDHIVYASQTNRKELLTINNLITTVLEPMPISTLYVTLKGNIPKIKDEDKKYRMGFFSNGELKASHALEKGRFEWSIRVGPNKSKQIVFFKLIDKDKKIIKNPKITIPIDSLSLKGFIDTSKIIDIEKVTPHCKQQKNSIYCQIDAPKNKRMIELPVYYYPDMLEVTVNNKLSSYASIFYGNAPLILTDVKPGLNTIEVKFRGLLWANYFSYVFWIIWEIFLVYYFARKILFFFRQKFFLQKL